jgi:hypothetical protein
VKRYLLHRINHTTLVVDITPIGLPVEILPDEGVERTLFSLRFRKGGSAEQFLLKAGARPAQLQKVNEAIRKTSLAVLTILDEPDLRDSGRSREAQ